MAVRHRGNVSRVLGRVLEKYFSAEYFWGPKIGHSNGDFWLAFTGIPHTPLRGLDMDPPGFMSGLAAPSCLCDGRTRALTSRGAASVRGARRGGVATIGAAAPKLPRLTLAHPCPITCVRPTPY